MRTVAVLCWFYSWSSFMPSVWVRDVPCASVPAFLIQDHSGKASWAPAHSSGDSQAPRLQMCFFGAGWSPGSLCADGLLPYIYDFSSCVCLCFYFSSSLKLGPIVPYSATSILGVDLAAVCWMCSIPDSLFVWFVLGFSARSNLLAPCSCDSCRGTSTSRVPLRQGWWCFASSEELSWAVISSLSSPLQSPERIL